jgi:hypothetical protein
MVGYYVFVSIQQAEVKRAFLMYKPTLSDDDLLVFKVPIPLYHQNDRDFEMTEGQFESGGRVYEMVKQRLKNDTLFVYCFNDIKTQKLNAALSEHTQKYLIDYSGKTDKREHNPLNTFIKEYLPFALTTLVPDCNFFVLKQSMYQNETASLYAVSVEITSPPPELI